MNIRRAAGSATAVACASLALAGCGSSGSSSTDGPTVLASFYPLAFVAERVGGDDVTVENLTQPGAESHDLELTARQVGQVADADLVVYLQGFQPSVDAAVEQNAEGAALNTADVVELEHHESDEDDEQHDEDRDEHGDHDHGDLDGDPHIWLDPTNLVSIADAVAEHLAEIDPDHAERYRANADELAAELNQLDSEFAAGLEQCERDTIVVAHEAFGYLADRYGLHQVGIAGLDPDAEPSPERVAEIHEIVEAEDVTTIFYERLVSPKVAETVADDLGVETAVLDPIEGRTDETGDQDYLALMRANLEALRAANGCG